ncbi:MAG: hypothetical protein V1862_10695 [Methanobacteriota archaeon]
MSQKRNRITSQKSWTHILKIYRRIFLICIITICAFTIHATSLPMVTFPLKPSPDTGPYQDEEFLEEANTMIYSLSNQTMPNGTELLNLLSMQQKLAKMNVSPSLYPKAKQINAYLYYSAKAGYNNVDAMMLTTAPWSPVYHDTSRLNEALKYQDASQVMWNQIKDMYPDVIPYKLSTFDDNTIQISDSGLW